MSEQACDKLQLLDLSHCTHVPNSNRVNSRTSQEVVSNLIHSVALGCGRCEPILYVSLGKSGLR